MRSPGRLLAASLFFAILVTFNPSAEPSSQVLQQRSSISAEVQGAATDVAQVTIVSTTYVVVDNETHTVAVVEIESTSKGSLDGQVLVHVPGGVSPDGYTTTVSHQPSLQTGERLELALLASRQPQIGLAVNQQLAAYVIVGGDNGAVSIADPTVLRSEAFGQFILNGGSFKSFPVSYRINPAGSGLSASSTVGSVRIGFQSWLDAPESAIDVTYAGTSPSNGYSGDGLNTVFWGLPNANEVGTLAITAWRINPQGQTTEFDIKFNRNFLWAAGKAPGRYDIATLTRHEAGHALGLADLHVQSATAPEIMYQRFATNTVLELGPGDREGAAWLYPRATISSPPDGATLACAPAVLQWTGPHSGTYVVAAGSSAGGTDYVHQAVGPDTSYLIENLPDDGSPVHVQLWHRRAGLWEYSLHDSVVYRSCLAPKFFDRAVDWAIQTGITTETAPGTFDPYGTINRAQMATFLWRYAGSPAGGPHGFSDVPEGRYFSTAIGWLAASDITTGTSATTFSPNDPVTRAQMAAFLWRFSGRPNAPDSGFVDVPTGQYYSTAVGWMADSGVTTGTTATTFSPTNVLTRGQAVTFLWRLDGQP